MQLVLDLLSVTEGRCWAGCFLDPGGGNSEEVLPSDPEDGTAAPQRTLTYDSQQPSCHAGRHVLMGPEGSTQVSESPRAEAVGSGVGT